MTKKHFKALADELSFRKPRPPASRESLDQWEEDVKGIAAVCSQFNPRFSHARFYSACGFLFSHYSY